MQACRGSRSNWLASYFSRACKPLAGVLLDFWQADEKGRYDNSGFRLRGHQFSDSEGRYRVREPSYPASTPAARAISSEGAAERRPRADSPQLYFPGKAQNRSDGLFRKELPGAHSQERWMARRTFRLCTGLGFSPSPSAEVNPAQLAFRMIRNGFSNDANRSLRTARPPLPFLRDCGNSPPDRLLTGDTDG